MTWLKYGSPIEGLNMEDVELTAGAQLDSVGEKVLKGQTPLGLMKQANGRNTNWQLAAARDVREGHPVGDRQRFNAIGVTPAIPKQARNKPCGCGSGKKAKKCCGDYAKPAVDELTHANY